MRELHELDGLPGYMGCAARVQALCNHVTYVTMQPTQP
jgi:hypothetical protein